MIDKAIPEEFYKALIVGNRQKCTEITQLLINSDACIVEIYESVFRDSLYRVGEMWELGKISVATEHLASALVENLLNEFYYKILSNKKHEKNVIVASVENEQHQIGCKMVADVFEMNGWTAHFNGANTPTKKIIDFVKALNPDMLALSMSLYFHLPALEQMIRAVRAESPKLPIIVGGQGLTRGGDEVLARYAGVRHIKNLQEIAVMTSLIDSKNGMDG